jgi:dihydropyrimidinase
VIDVLVKQALARGETVPRQHALTRPPATEAEAAGRAIALAALAGTPLYIVHLSCAAALEEVRAARRRGQAVFAETCPQYLFLSLADYDRPGFDGAGFVMSPPLREASDQEALWHGLARGELQVVSTDHCPFTRAEKSRGRHDFSKIPNGAPGIETRMTLLWDGGVRAGRIEAQRFVELTAAAPARLFGLWPRKGTIAVGSDADLVLWDPEKETRLSAETLHMRVDYNPYEGRLVRGGPAVVMSRGELIVEHGEWKGRAGRGQFLKRRPS